MTTSSDRLRILGLLAVGLILAVVPLACSRPSEQAPMDPQLWSHGSPPAGYPPTSVEEAIQLIMTSEPEYQLHASGDLIEWSREDTSVVECLMTAIRAAPPGFPKQVLATTIVEIRQDHRDQAAYFAMEELLSDPDVALQIAIGFAQEGNPVGAEIMREASTAGHANTASEREQSDAQDAEYWLRQLGLE